MEKLVGWTKHCNKEVLQRVNETKTMFDTVGKRKSVVITEVRRGRPQEEKNAPVERPDERKVGLYMALKRIAEGRKEWQKLKIAGSLTPASQQIT